MVMNMVLCSKKALVIPVRAKPGQEELDFKNRFYAIE
jgi:hypothetical protein